MKKTAVLLALVAFFFALQESCAIIYRWYPFIQRRETGDLEARLRQAASSCSRLELTELGAVEYENFSAPIWLLTIHPKETARHRILIAAGIHGNEPAGVEAALRFIEELAADPSLYGTARLDFIPLMNPWGWSHDVRFNREGIDISRQYGSFQAEETRIIEGFLSGRNYDLVLSLHESINRGFYTLTYGNRDISANAELGRMISDSGYRVRIFKGLHGYIHVNDHDLSGKKSRHTFALFVRMNNSSNAHIIEIPIRMPLEDRVKIGLAAQHFFIRDLLQHS